MAWVYILEMESGHCYVGSTTDIDRRLVQHSQKHTKTTARLKIKSLALKQEYSTLGEARKIERRIKKLKRKDYIEKIVKEGYIKIQPY